MTDNIINLHERPDMRGPDRRGNSVIIENRLIPHIHMHDRGETITFVLDNRFEIDVPRGLAHNVGWFVSNAMAVASGYPFLGAESKERPFAPQCHAIDLSPKSDA